MIDAAILTTIHAVAQRHQSTYSVPSQTTILKLLERYHGIIICRRTLCYRLESLERAGAIARIKRHYRSAAGVLIFRSTAYYILPFARKIMKSVANLANRFFYGFRVQETAHNLYGNYICNKDMLKSTIKTSLPSSLSPTLHATLNRMTLHFGRG